MKVKILTTQQIMEIGKVPKTTQDILIMEGLLAGEEINFQAIKDLNLGQTSCVSSGAGYSKGFSIGFNS